MYEGFYGFSEKPFNITPDPKFLFLSAKHQEAISHLLYGIQERGGFIVMTGEVGTGKTILCRYMLNQLDEMTDGAVILNPNLSALELLKAINEDFGIHSTGRSKKELHDELNQFLLERRRLGHNMVLVIDEAQNLAPAVLEEVRLLSNLETEKEKLIQIILLGQPELRELLQLQDLRQLNQRITARYHLMPLNASETADYVRHRMGVAGNRAATKFTARAMRKIFAFSGGTPRLINVLCDRLLLSGYAENTRVVLPKMVAQAAREVAGDALHRPSRLVPVLRVTAAAAAMAACVALGWQLGSGARPGQPVQQAAAAAVPPAVPVAPEPLAEPARRLSPARAHPTPMMEPPATAPALAPVPAPVPTPKIAPPPKAVATPEPAAAPKPVHLAAAPRPPAPRAAAPPRTQPIAALTSRDTAPAQAADELRVISSLFGTSESRVRTRVPAIIETTLAPVPPLAARRPPSATVPAAAAPPPALRLTTPGEVARIVSDLDPYQSRLDAVETLSSLWGRDFRVPKEANDPNFSDFYKLALGHGMRCSELWANFDTLRQINLPGILEVFGPSAPTSRYVVLAGIHDDGTATIVWGPGGSARVNLQALDECWRRRVFVFWEEHEGLGEIMREGDAGEHVRWVQDSLRTLGYFTGSADGVYAPPTQAAVAEFQRAFHLLPDGVVGPRTRMVLYSRLSGYPTPNLTPVGEATRDHHQQRATETAG